MAKTSIIKREEKREKLVKKYQAKREQAKIRLKQLYVEATKPDADHETVEKEIYALQVMFQKLSRNSAEVRLVRRCQKTGRPKGVLRKFKLGRTKVREFAMLGWLPGVRKASW